VNIIIIIIAHVVRTAERIEQKVHNVCTFGSLESLLSLQELLLSRARVQHATF
jgi:hypothetical protein